MMATHSSSKSADLLPLSNVRWIQTGKSTFSFPHCFANAKTMVIRIVFVDLAETHLLVGLSP